MDCPLCFSKGNGLFSQIHQREYLKCSVCSLIYLDQKFYLSEESEKKVYDQHRNNPDDLKYQNFLNQLASPMKSLIRENSKGLDFGCGSGPTLSKLFEKSGHLMNNFDKFYYPNFSVLNEKYHFIVMTEVIEHLKNPYEVLRRLNDLFIDDGYFGFMTKVYNEKIDFQKWYYHLDPTHIIFLSIATFHWIATEFNKKILYTDNDNVVILGS